MEENTQKVIYTEEDTRRWIYTKRGRTFTKRNIYARKYMEGDIHGKNTQMGIYTDGNIYRLGINGE